MTNKSSDQNNRARDSTSRQLSRRNFLRGAGAVVLGALVSACRRAVPETFSTSSPSPSPATTTQVFLPAVGSQGSTATPSITAAPSPVGSPTPVPTPTPTPFPPGPPSKLGIFIIRPHAQVYDLMSTGNVALVKTIEHDPIFLNEIKALSPGALFVGRLLMPQVDLGKIDPVAEARRVVNLLLPVAGDSRRMEIFDAWEGYNEPVASDAEQVKRLADMEAERVRLLAGYGIRSVIGNFSAGQPPLEDWPHFRPALESAREHGGYLGLHEYSAPVMQFGTEGDEGWLTLRYRKVYRQQLIPAGLDLPLVITECGIDGTVGGSRPGPDGQGWQHFVRYWAELGMGTDGAGNYIEQLAWYDSELMKDDYVVGAAIFAINTTKDWQTYDILGEAAAILERYLAVHPPKT